MYANLADLSVSDEVFFPYNDFIPLGERKNQGIPPLLMESLPLMGKVIEKSEHLITLSLTSCDRVMGSIVVKLKLPHYCQFDKIVSDLSVAKEPEYVQLTFEDISF